MAGIDHPCLQSRCLGEGTSRPVSVISQSFPAGTVCGKRLRYSGWIRTESINDGAAQLWWRVDGPRGQLRLYDLGTAAPRGTTNWRRYDITIDVEPTAVGIWFGLLHVGCGTAWFSDICIEVDGAVYRCPFSAEWEPPAAEIHWVAKHAIPFSKIESGADSEEFAPVLRAIGEARIVALGEATHGSTEFCQFKHRLTKLLVSEKDFSLVGIEANMAEVFALNRYIQSGEGDPRQLLEKTHSWMWNTEEALEFVEWMRKVNMTGGGQVELWGFDTQIPTLAMEVVEEFLREADTPYLPFAKHAYEYGRNAWRESIRRTETSEDIRLWGEQAWAVLDHMQRHAPHYYKRNRREAVEKALQHARLVLQSARCRANPGFRDLAMAANVQWILGQSPAGSKAVLWAHNSHVQLLESQMGGCLASAYPDIFTIGLAAYEGRYTAVGSEGLGTYHALRAPPRSIEGLLHCTKIQQHCLNLRDARGQSDVAILNEPREFRGIGARAREDGFASIPLAERFDMLAYFERIEPTRRLRRTLEGEEHSPGLHRR